jgi:hypothetical protein
LRRSIALAIVWPFKASGDRRTVVTTDDVLAPGSTGPSESGEDQSSPRRRVLLLVLRYGAAGTAATFLASIAVNLISICFVRHPFVGYSDNILQDAKAVATGHVQYGNPATQYVGFPYTPLYTWVVAGLLKAYWWEGWGPVVSMLAALATLAALVRLAWTSSRRWQSRLLTASFIVALSLGGLAALPTFGLPGGLFGYPNFGQPVSGVFDARPDQLAWCLLIVAATIVFRALLAPNALSVRQMVVTGLLLAGSVLTKQTTLVPCLLVAVLAMVVPRVVDSDGGGTWTSWLRAAVPLLTFVVVPAVVGLVLQLTSHGYAYDLLVNLPLRYARTIPLGTEVGTSLRLLAVPLIALLVLVVCVRRSSRDQRARYQRRHVVAAVAAVVLAISPLPTSILAESKLGGAPNHLAGPVWTITLGCGVLLLLLRPSLRHLVAGAVACGILLVSIAPFSSALSGRVGVPDLHQELAWHRMDPYLIAAVDRGQAVLDEGYPSLSVSPKATAFPAGDMNDVLAGGYTPRWLIGNVLAGRYALVHQFSEWDPRYDSDAGRYDGSVLWKLNLLLKMGYKPIKEPYSRTVFYQPTPRLVRLGWFAGCFGPYQAQGAGVRIRLRGTGGLVCIDAGRLRLRKAPDPTTNFVLTLKKGGGVAIVHAAEDPQTLRVTPLSANDRAAAPSSAVGSRGSAVAECLVRGRRDSILRLKAVGGIRNARCRSDQNGAVLEVPLSGGASSAHVLLRLGVADAPAITAATTAGRPVPFKLLDLTPSDINGL